ncbi:hypothetical protein F4604DRAFT_1758249 [Suillus subluteus]|nr:hypothetical protein F4604DRAFT_1758249 [Suillus subluteus]
MYDESVLGNTSACMHANSHVRQVNNFSPKTSIRAIGKRAHPMHVLTFFRCGAPSYHRWGSQIHPCIPRADLILLSNRMIVLSIPVVHPTPWGWILLLMVGVFGFVTQTLLTMGLQRETVSRGVTGMYTQVLFAVML